MGADGLLKAPATPRKNQDWSDMAKESSFDIVSVTDMQEVDNAYQQTTRELRQRYDLKDSGASIELDKAKGSITIAAPSDFVAGQVEDVLDARLVRRKVDPKCIRWGGSQAASGGTVRRVGTIVQGIDPDLARKIRKDVQDQKLSKVKVAIEGDKLRVTSPSKDALQGVIGFLREQDYGQPLSFENYR